MTDTTGDPFADAKSSLRDTVKWLVTVFSALAAAVVGGASIAGLSGAKGTNLPIALIGGGIGVACLVAASGIALKLLTAESFHVADIHNDPKLRARLDRYANDILPPEVRSVEEFIIARTSAIDQLRRYVKVPDSSQYKEARATLLSIDGPLGRLVNLAQFESMRTKFDRSIPILFALAIGALVSLGTFAVTVGSAKDSVAKLSGMGGPIATLSLGKEAASIAAAYASLCGAAAQVHAEIISQPKGDWLTVRVVEPTACAGLVFSVPSALAGMR